MMKMVVKIQMKSEKYGNKNYFTNLEKAKELVRKYKKDKIEIKELAGVEQILITIGGIVLGYFATDMANRIASEIE